MEYSFSCLENC